jgi:hypothetical protein
MVLRRPHITLEQYGSPSDWSMAPYNYDVVRQQPAPRKRSPYVVCVHNHHHHHHYKTSCACASMESQQRQWAMDAQARAQAAYGDGWQLQLQQQQLQQQQQQQLQPYPYNYPYPPMQQLLPPPANNQVMVVPASSRPYRQPSAYSQPVYQDPKGRLYTVDAYGKSKWI